MDHLFVTFIAKIFVGLLVAAPFIFLWVSKFNNPFLDGCATGALIVMLIWSFVTFVILATKLAKHWINKL